VSAAVIGETWKVGSAVLEVAQPREPCFKLGIRMGDAGFKDRFAAADRPGAYLRIVAEGDVGAGDGLHVLDRPEHGFTILDLLHTTADPTQDRLERALAIDAVPSDWRAWAERRLSR